MERQPENVLCGFRLLLLVGCAAWLRTRLGIFCFQAALMTAANGSCYGGVQGLAPARDGRMPTCLELFERSFKIE